MSGRLVGQGRAQPQHAVGDRHGGVARRAPPRRSSRAPAGAAAPSSRRARRSSDASRSAPSSSARTTPKPKWRSSGPGAARRTRPPTGSPPARVLEQRGLAESGGRREDDDRALAFGQPGHRLTEDGELARALDEGRLGAARRRPPGPDDVQMARVAAATRRVDRGGGHTCSDARRGFPSRARGGRRRGAGGGALASPYWSAPRSTTGVMSVLTSGATWTSSRPPSVLTRSASSAASLPVIVVCAARPVVSTCEPARVTRTCSALSPPLRLDGVGRAVAGAVEGRRGRRWPSSGRCR